MKGHNAADSSNDGKQELGLNETDFCIKEYSEDEINTGGK